MSCQSIFQCPTLPCRSWQPGLIGLTIDWHWSNGEMRASAASWASAQPPATGGAYLPSWKIPGELWKTGAVSSLSLSRRQGCRSYSGSAALLHRRSQMSLMYRRRARLLWRRGRSLGVGGWMWGVGMWSSAMRRSLALSRSGGWYRSAQCVTTYSSPSSRLVTM